MRRMMLLFISILVMGCGSDSSESLVGVAGSSERQSDGPLLREITEDVTAEFVVKDDWGGGFVAEVTLRNTGAESVEGWSASFQLPISVGNVWNAVLESHQGETLTFEGVDYNRAIPPGGSVTFGFVGNPGGIEPPDEIRVLVDSQGLPDGPSDPPVEPPSDPTPPVEPDSTLDVVFLSKSDWGSGMTGTIRVTNSSSKEVSDWRVEFELPAEISNIWNAEIVSHFGTHYTLGAAPYNQVLAPGQVVELGFQAEPGGVSPTALTAGAGTAGPEEPPLPEEPPTEPEEPDPPSVATGFLSTSGADIVDSEGRVVRLTGVNWFGMETETYCPHGLWTRSLDSCLDQISELGYNCLRLPYSNEMLQPGRVPNGINFAKNPELQGLSGIEIMDAVIEGAGERGMRVILDRHRPSASSQSELWYTGQYSEEQWISDWETLALRYRDNPTVVGFDLHNEPHGPATWGSGDPNTDWRLAAQRAGNRILAVNPNLLIIVEGIGDNYWWGGNLSKAGTHPVVLNLPGRLVYSPHDYPQSVYDQSWFHAPDYPQNLAALWDHHWGHLVRTNTAPVLLGEFGTRLQTESDRLWFDSIANYIEENDLSFTFWCFNPNSTDTGGLLQDDWNSIHQNKQSVLAPLQFPLFR